MIENLTLSRRTVLGVGTTGAVALVAGGALASPAGAVGALNATQITSAQTRLNNFGYWCGPADGTANELTTCAVLAYQKARGMTVDGILDYDVAVSLTKTQPAPTRFTNSGLVVEVDLKRQLLRVVSSGKVTLTLHATTGDGDTSSFGSRGVLNRTPAGKFRVRKASDGIVTNSLGSQYRPFAFRGVYAVFGMSGIADVRAASTPGGVAVHKDALDLLAGKNYLTKGRLIVIG